DEIWLDGGAGVHRRSADGEAHDDRALLRGAADEGEGGRVLDVPGTRDARECLMLIEAPGRARSSAPVHSTTALRRDRSRRPRARANLATPPVDLELRLARECSEPVLGVARQLREPTYLVPAAIAEPLDDRVVDLRSHCHLRNPTFQTGQSAACLS